MASALRRVRGALDPDEIFLPFRGPTFVSDGARLWMLLRRPDLGERWVALLGLLGETRAGVTPERMSADLLTKAIGVRDASTETVAAHALAYSAAFHARRDEEAGRRLETCVEYSGTVAPAMREALMSDAAVFQARRRGRVDLAQEWLASIPAATGLLWLRRRVDAAILEAQGDLEGARRTLKECEASILSMRDPTQRDSILRSLRRWAAELDRR